MTVAPEGAGARGRGRHRRFPDRSVRTKRSPSHAAWPAAPTCGGEHREEVLQLLVRMNAVACDRDRVSPPDCDVGRAGGRRARLVAAGYRRPTYGAPRAYRGRRLSGVRGPVRRGPPGAGPASRRNASGPRRMPRRESPCRATKKRRGNPTTPAPLPTRSPLRPDRPLDRWPSGGVRVAQGPGAVPGHRTGGRPGDTPPHSNRLTPRGGIAAAAPRDPQCACDVAGGGRCPGTAGCPCGT